MLPIVERMAENFGWRSSMFTFIQGYFKKKPKRWYPPSGPKFTLTQGYISPELLANLKAHEATLKHTAADTFINKYIKPREIAKANAYYRWIGYRRGDNR
jgi:hypothetical protein